MQEIPQSRNTALPRHQKKETWGTNNYKTKVIYETIDAQTKKYRNKGTPLKRSTEKQLEFEQVLLARDIFNTT